MSDVESVQRMKSNGMRLPPLRAEDDFDRLLAAAIEVVEACDLHRSDYSSIEWAALSKLRAVCGMDSADTQEDR